MKRAILISLVSLLSLMILLTSSAAASDIFHFNQVAPQNPNLDANFDIVYFGATPDGNFIDFWIQVRGNIDKSPQDGYINAYIINIYGNETYEIAAVWWNSEENITEKAWITKGGNTTPLQKNEYAVSGNRIIFYIPESILSDVGDKYHLTVTTLHMEYTSSTIITDTADYFYNPHEYPEESEGIPNYIWPLVGATLIILIVAIVFSVLKKGRE